MDLDVIVINISYLKLITVDISMIERLKFSLIPLLGVSLNAKAKML